MARLAYALGAVVATAILAGLVYVRYREPEDAASAPRIPTARSMPVRTESGVAGALDLLLRTTWTTRIHVDVSSTMDRPVRLAPASPDVLALLGAAPEGGTPRAFAARFVELFDEAARRTPKVVALALDPSPAELERARPLELMGLFEGPRIVAWRSTPARRRLLDAQWDGPTYAVVIVGSAGARTAAADLAPASDDGFGVVLVIDLSPDGGAREIARAYAAPPRVVVCWSPLAANP